LFKQDLLAKYNFYNLLQKVSPTATISAKGTITNTDAGLNAYGRLFVDPKSLTYANAQGVLQLNGNGTAIVTLTQILTRIDGARR
jgi:hypothetical protein